MAAALDVNMVLKLVDKASGPGKAILDRIYGGVGKAGKGVANEIDGTGLSAKAANGAMLALNRSMATFAAGAAGYVGFRSMIGGAVAFESAMADVEKKVSMAPHEFAALAEQIKQISRETPLAATEIASLVAQAGQFGIANKELIRFAMLGSKAAVAFDMGATEAADSLSQIKNALKLNMKELEDYADAINMVADSTGSSEAQLVDFVLRTGAGAMSAGLDPKDLLAFGSALTEVGISSQRAGTGVNGMLAKMSALTSKKATSKILDQIGGKGYSAKLQKKFFETPRDALLDLMKITREMSRPDRARLFIDLFGLETQDEANAFAGQVDKVTETLEKLGDASSYAGSVQRTFDGFAATTEKQWARFTNNVELAASAMGAKMLPAINDSLQYLNEFFATAEGRVNIIDRLKASFGGFITGIGYKGGSAAFFADMTAGLKEVRDLMFGIEGDDNFGEGGARIFERWRKFGEELKNSPIAAIFDSIGNADVASLGGGLMAGAVGMGALSVAARIALSPLRAILAVLKATAKVAYALSGLKLAKWLLDLAGGGPDIAKEPKTARPGGGIAGYLAWLRGLAVAGAPGVIANGLAETPGDTLDKQVENQRKYREGLQRLFGMGPPSHSEERERDPSIRNIPQGIPVPAAPATPPAPVPFSFGQLWRDLMQPIGGQPKANGGAQAVNVTGPVTTTPSGVQQVHVTNPPPAPVVNVTVHATTNAAPAEIGAAVGNQVSAALRQNLADGGE